MIGPEIRDLLKCFEFESNLAQKEKTAWICIKEVCDKFLGKTRAPNYKQCVENLILALRDINCNMSVKIHMLHSHIDAFPILQNEANDEQGEKFHQDISYLECRYKGKSKLRMLSDYCWNSIRDDPNVSFSRKRKMPFFSPTKST